MLRRTPLLALALLACHTARTDAGNEAPASPEAARASDTQPAPAHLRLPWGATLYAAPNEHTIALQLGVTEDVGTSRPAVAVVGREGDFWKVARIDDVTRSELGADSIEGLDFYDLALYLPVGVGDPIQPIPPGPDAEPEPSHAVSSARAEALAANSGLLGALAQTSANPPLQSGGQRAPGLETDFRVGPPSTVYWSDGRVAGQVVREHAFVDRGSSRASTAGPLRCFGVRVGPDDGGQGELCFAEARVVEAKVEPEPEWMFANVFGDDDLASLEAYGNLYGDDYGGGGLGLVGTGEGGGGGGLGGIGGVTIGSGGGGGGGDGIGSVGIGTITPQSATDLKLGKPKITGTLDANVGRRIIRTHFDELRDCWLAEGATGGTVELGLDYDAQGDVVAVRASSGNKAVDACVAKAAKSWSFPSGVEGSISLIASFGDAIP